MHTTEYILAYLGRGRAPSPPSSEFANVTSAVASYETRCPQQVAAASGLAFAAVFVALVALEVPM